MARDEIVNMHSGFAVKESKEMGRGKRRGSLLLFGISSGEITGYYYVDGNDPIRCRWERGELLM